MQTITSLRSVLIVTAVMCSDALGLGADRERWRHPGGAFERVGNKIWSEEVRGKDAVARHEFEELDRSETAITLYDKSRDCTVRILVDAVEVKSPKQGVPEFKVFYRGKFVPTRDRWGHVGGEFNLTGEKTWTETADNGRTRHTFKEVDRNLDFITLRDEPRDCTVRIYETAVDVKNPKQGVPEFKTFYNGEWFKPRGVNTGKLSVTNDYGEAVTIQLQHGESAPGTIFATYTVQAGQTAALQHDGKDLVVAANWVIVVKFRNGSSKSDPIGGIADFADGRVVVKASAVKH